MKGKQVSKELTLEELQESFVPTHLLLEGNRHGYVLLTSPENEQHHGLVQTSFKTMEELRDFLQDALEQVNKDILLEGGLNE